MHTDAGCSYRPPPSLATPQCTQGVVWSEIAPQFGFQSVVETFQDASLDVIIFSRKEMDHVFCQPLLKFTIGKFSSFVGLQSLGER